MAKPPEVGHKTIPTPLSARSARPRGASARQAVRSGAEPGDDTSKVHRIQPPPPPCLALGVLAENSSEQAWHLSPPQQQPVAALPYYWS